MEITNFIEREQVEKLREKIEEFRDILSYEIPLYYAKGGIGTHIAFLDDVDGELHQKLMKFNSTKK